jgi:hypothetical protein
MEFSIYKALKLFPEAVIDYGGILFVLKAKEPSRVTAAVIAELDSV